MRNHNKEIPIEVIYGPDTRNVKVAKEFENHIDPEYYEKEKADRKERYHKQMKDPKLKAEEQERDRIRKKNNKVQKQIDSIFKLNENDKLFNRTEL